jgi:hypothetical protein
MPSAPTMTTDQNFLDSLYAKRLERGKFIWPSPADGVVVITPAQLGYMCSHFLNSVFHLGRLRRGIYWITRSR